MRRSTASFVVFAVATAASPVCPGCAEGEDRARLVRAYDPTPPRAVLDGSPILVPELLDIAGTIASDVPARSVGREVVLVDAKGERRNVVTGADGAFVFDRVSAPYDVAVEPTRDGPVVVYLGLQRRDPFIPLSERELGGPTVRQTLRVDLQMDRSPCANAPGWVTVVTTSSWGGGTTVAPCVAGERFRAVDVEHIVDNVVGSGVVAVHVLVEDDGGTAYAYARTDVTPSDAGLLTEVGRLEPLPIAFGPWVTLEASGEASLMPDWRWMTAVSLDVGGEDGRAGRTLLSSMSEGATLRRPLPAIPGASMSASVFGWHPKADGKTPFYRSTEAWSGARTPTSKPLALPVAAGPDIVHPKETERLAARDFAMEWNEGTSRSLAMLSVRNPSGSVFQVVTEEHEIAPSRLDALGVRPLDAGDYALELAAFPNARVDDVTSPVLSIRSRRFDRSHAGATTLLRVPFQIVFGE